MAERRMFSKSVIDSDAFLDMPLSTQALYFHLSMWADDEGFVGSPKTIQRLIGASADDLKLLIAKGFLLAFESGVVVVTHWKIHNYIRADRLQKTTYASEKSLITVSDTGAYLMADVSQMSVRCQSDVSQVTDKRQSSDGQATDNCPHRLGKDSIDKYSIEVGKNRIGKDRLYINTVYYNNTELNQLFTNYLRQITDTEPLTEQEIEAEKRTLEELAVTPLGNFSELKATLIIKQSLANGWYGLHSYVSKRGEV